ncbi:hypothetical protein D9V34_15240 [Mycetocola lacteus]|uniref:Protein kinase domain-containing protein n=1 Tax=Mycetocola lacteus TaxID=76637 RepID=A0A3L7AIV1_9MICO|nr:hypothetical protein D9V34_15240 [Mycetocola lacteus]
MGRLGVGLRADVQAMVSQIPGASMSVLSERRALVGKIMVNREERFVLKAGASSVESIAREWKTISKLGDAQNRRRVAFRDSRNGRVALLRWVDGEDLSSALRRHPERLLPLLAAARAELVDTHHSGAFHGDIQPAHLRVRGTRIRLIDFGEAGNAGLYGGGLVYYAAPENAAMLLENERATRGPEEDWHALIASFAAATIGAHPVTLTATHPSFRDKMLAVRRRSFAPPPAQSTPEVRALFGLLSVEPEDRQPGLASLLARYERTS